MLPSRGILRATPSLGANSRLLLISKQATRSFGASVRSSNASFRPRTLPLGPMTGSRIGTPLTAVSTTLVFQFRNASTTPTPAPTPPPAGSAAASETVDSIAEKASQVDISSFQDSILDMPEHIGYLKELGLDFGWGPTATMQWIMEHIHVYSGMPWWGTLTVMAILFRGIMFIPSLKAAEMSIKMNAFKSNPDAIRLQQKMRESMEQKKMDEFIRARGELDILRKVMGISFGPSMLSLLNIPLGFGIFRSVRAMCELPLPAMENGGLLWFPDLSIPDPLYILPAFGAVGLLLMLRVNPAGSPQQMAMMKLMGYVLTPLIFLATLWLPAALQFFFAISGALSMFQAWLRLQPWFRDFMGLSYVPSKSRIEAAAKKMKWQPPAATASNPAVVSSQPVHPQQSRKKTAANRALEWMGIRPAIEEFKSTYHQAMIDRTKQNEYSAEKEELDKAIDYEKKRREEIQQGLEARLDAARWERMMRREQQKAETVAADRRQQARKNSTKSTNK